jgi:hypothetical protein
MAVHGYRPGLGREPRPPPLDAKVLGPLGAWALPYQKSHFCFFLVFGRPPNQDRRPGPRSACPSTALVLAARTRTRDRPLDVGSSQSQTTLLGPSQLNQRVNLAPPAGPSRHASQALLKTALLNPILAPGCFWHKARS